MILSWNVGQDTAVAAVGAAFALVGSWQYTRTRADASRDAIDLLRTNLEALEDRRKIDTEVHEAQVAELTRKLAEVQAEGRVLQAKAVDRLVAMVADTIASQTREVMVEIRQHLTSIDVTTRTIRRGMGTRRADRAEGDLEDEEDEASTLP